MILSPMVSVLCIVVLNLLSYSINNNTYFLADEWTLQDGYKRKAEVFEEPNQKLEVPYRTLIPGIRGGLSFKLVSQVSINVDFYC